MKPFKSMWDENLRHMTTATHRVELEPPVTRPIHFVPYRGGLKARDLGKNKIDNTISMNFIELAQTELTPHVLFDPEKDRTLKCSVDYHKRNDFKVPDSFVLQNMNECIDSLGDADVFSKLASNSAY